MPNWRPAAYEQRRFSWQPKSSQGGLREGGYIIILNEDFTYRIHQFQHSSEKEEAHRLGVGSIAAAAAGGRKLDRSPFHESSRCAADQYGGSVRVTKTQITEDASQTIYDKNDHTQAIEATIRVPRKVLK